jgi:hypothetical protein
MFMTNVYSCELRFFAFPATEYDDVFSVYQPVDCLSGEKTKVLKTISVLVLRVLLWLRLEEESFYC